MALDAEPSTSQQTQSNGDAASSQKAAKAKLKGAKASSALDPEAIEAKRKARAEKKEREAHERAQKEAEAAANGFSAPTVDSEGRPLYLPRQWGLVKDVQAQAEPGKRRIRVLSWNMLAQGLVRRKLFPGSDALRWKDREAGLAAELAGHDWDLGCFQEVDRIECHSETLARAGYSHVYAKGYSQKQHGLLLAWRTRPKMPGSSEGSSSAVFEEKPVASKTFFYDDAEVSPGRTACSRITRNIALFAAVRFRHPAKDSKHQGVIIATTHLFWHPMHAYERVRQVGLLTRALDSFRNQTDAPWAGWPTFLAGDFNDQPHSASYALLTGLPLHTHGREEIGRSRVVHQSIDDRREKKSRGEGQEAPPTLTNLHLNGESPRQASQDDAASDEEPDEEGEEDEEGGADDQMLKNCRSAQDSDALLSAEELAAICKLTVPGLGNHTSSSGLLSAYGDSYHNLQGAEERDNLFSTSTRGRERWDDSDWKEGDTNVHHALAGTPAGNEPMWTLYSSLFGLTLDFIFLFPVFDSEAKATYPKVTRLLRTHRTDQVKAGLPRKGVCVSDHVAVGAEIEV